MATSEKDRPNPGKESPHVTGEVGDGKLPIEKNSPPQPDFPNGKDRPISDAKKSPKGSNGKPPIEKRYPPGKQGNPDGKNRPNPLAQKASHATGEVSKDKAPIEKQLPPRQPGNPKGKDRPKLGAQKSSTATGDVGYGKPPIDKRFQPGESGNIKGRPLGAKNKVRAFGVEQLKETALAELYREIETTEGGETVTRPAATLIIRKMVQKGTEGDPRAALLMLTMGQNIEAEKKAEQLELMQLAVDHKKGWADNFAYCKKHDLPIPEVYPHPDHVIINYDTGSVTFNGPCSAEEKVRMDDLVKSLGILDFGIAVLQAELRNKRKAAERTAVEARLAEEHELRERLLSIIPAWALVELKKPPAKE